MAGDARTVHTVLAARVAQMHNVMTSIHPAAYPAACPIAAAMAENLVQAGCIPSEVEHRELTAAKIMERVRQHESDGYSVLVQQADAERLTAQQASPST